MKMAEFRRHDATVALRQADKAGITETLIETLFGNASAVHAFDLLQILDANTLTEVIAKRDLLTTELKTVAHRIGGLGVHLVKITLQLHPSPDQAENRFLQRSQAYLSPAWALVNDVFTCQ
jgi:hypothetical protein